MKSRIFLARVSHEARFVSIVLLAAGFVVSAVDVAQGADKNRGVLAQSKIAKGEKLLKKQQFETAEQSFREAIEIESSIHDKLQVTVATDGFLKRIR